MTNPSHRPSRVVWFEIPVTDFDRAVPFYQAILETTLIQYETGPSRLAVFAYDRASGAVSGCLMQSPNALPSPDGACVYLNADPELDLVLERVEAAGGKVLLPRTALDAGMGFFAHIADPDGNRVGLHAMQ